MKQIWKNFTTYLVTRFHIETVSAEEQKQARKDLFVILSQLFLFLPLFCFGTMIGGIFVVKLFGPEPEISGWLMSFIIVLITSIFGGLIGEFIHMILLTYVLSLDDCLYYFNMPAPDFPVLTPIVNWMSRVVLQQKINRHKSN